MKKTLLFAMMLVGLSNVNAQQGHFKIGTHAGIPVGDFGERYSFNFGIDAAYLWKVSHTTEIGIATGFSNYFGKDLSSTYMGYSYNTNFGDARIIPLAGTVKLKSPDTFFIGTDIGYAFFLIDGLNGAFYYQPKIGFDFNKSELYLGYKGMSHDGTAIGSINFGYAYNF